MQVFKILSATAVKLHFTRKSEEFLQCRSKFWNLLGNLSQALETPRTPPIFDYSLSNGGRKSLIWANQSDRKFLTWPKFWLTKILTCLGTCRRPLRLAEPPPFSTILYPVVASNHWYERIKVTNFFWHPYIKMTSLYGTMIFEKTDLGACRWPFFMENPSQARNFSI